MSLYHGVSLSELRDRLRFSDGFFVLRDKRGGAWNVSEHVCNVGIPEAWVLSWRFHRLVQLKSDVEGAFNVCGIWEAAVWIVDSWEEGTIDAEWALFEEDPWTSYLIVKNIDSFILWPEAKQRSGVSAFLRPRQTVSPSASVMTKEHYQVPGQQFSFSNLMSALQNGDRLMNLLNNKRNDVVSILWILLCNGCGSFEWVGAGWWKFVCLFSGHCQDNEHYFWIRSPVGDTRLHNMQKQLSKLFYILFYICTLIHNKEAIRS